MSNKISLATIQFRADAKGVNPALDSIRQASKDAHDEVDRLKAALDRGVKTMKDVNGVDFDVEKKIARLTKEAKSFDAAIRELTKGATALEAVWKNIELGTIEKNSRAELKGAINAAQSRLRSIRAMQENGTVDEESLQRQRELNVLITEAQKQLNNLDRDTTKVIETIKKGGLVSESVLTKEKKGLEDMLKLIPKGTKEWDQYNQQLTEISEKIKTIALDEQRVSGQKTLGKAFRGDFSTADVKTLNDVIAKLREYQSVIEDPNGAGARHYAAAETQIKALQATLEKLKVGFSNADEVMQRFQQHLGEPKIETATRQTEKLAQTLDEKLSAATSEFDEDIKQATEDIAKWEKHVKESEEKLSSLETQRNKLSEKIRGRSALGRAVFGDSDRKKMSALTDKIEGDEDFMGARDRVESDKTYLQWAKESLEYYKQQKAEALGLNETVEQLTATEEAREGKAKQARRMTREEMQQGIKILEEEAMAQDRTTTEGQKRWEQLRQTIDDMNRELKESTGEWMSMAQAEELASKAGTDGWFATSEQMQKSVQAIERQRDALVKTIQQKQRDKQATAEDEAELKRLDKVLKDLKFEQDNFNMSHKQMADLLKQPKSAEDLEQLKAAIKRADGELRRMKQSLGENNKQYMDFAKQVKEAKGVLKEMEGQAKATTSAFDKAWSRLKTYVGLYVGAAVAMQKVTATAGDLLELSDKMGEVRKTTGFTADEVGRLTTELKKMDTRTTITGLLELSVAAGQLGLKTQEDVEGFTEAANKLMVALPEMGREGATEMLKVALATGEIDKIRKQMEQGLIEGSSATAVAMEKVGSTIDRLRATSAATAPAITDFVKRVGAVGAQSGITIDQVAALGSTVDALGMRVEMSATALSRMIPAIRNNAYSIGAMIGKTEEEIISKFDNGMGMDVILDIFEAIRRNSRTMTGDVEQDAAEVEKMFEKAGLKDIMKELNQMGARAGIVFAGLSQNVDELRRQLGVAAEAYEENIAIELEYQKMNETTAAKWERLKNQLEEFFVGDGSQRFLGGVIDGLRKIIDFLTGDGGISEAFRTILVYMAAVRLKLADIAVGGLTGIWNGIKNIGVALGVVKGQMVAMNYANIFMAIGAAVLYATKCFGLWGKEVSFSDRELAKADKAIADATEKLDRMFTRLNNLTTAVRRATEETEHLKEGSDELAQAEEKAALATEARKKTIDAINNAYGSYLGFMLTEYDRAELIAAAHDKITAALKREMYTRQQQQSMQAVSDEYTPKILDEWANTRQSLREHNVNSQVISELFENVQAIIDATKFDPNTGKFNIENEQYSTLQEALGEQLMANVKGFDELIATYMYRQLATRTQLTLDELQDITGMVGLKSTDRGNVYAGSDATMYMTRGELGQNNVRQGLMDVYTEFIQKRDEISDIFTASIGRWATEERKASVTLIDELKKKVDVQLTTITTSKDQTAIDQAYQELAQALLGLDNQIKILDQNVDAAIIDSIKTLADKANQSTDATKLTQARATAMSIFARATANKNNNQSNYDPNKPRGPYGNYDKRADPYEQWDANALVKRREEMLKRVRALAGGADVQTVLSMDKRFMDEATRKGIKNMRDAIAWYNEERLKIQEELHSRNLTNTGDWMDPKKGSKRKPKTPESEAAIAELDRYYLERKELIEEARSKEEMTEAEYNRRLDALEMEHLQKRSDLRQTFTSDDKQFIEQFRKWWASVKELDEVSWEIIEAEWKAAWERDRKYNNREAQKDLTQMQAIIVKQLKEIETIIDKERPFNGITTNLQDNLTKMGLLFKDGVPEGDKFMEENTRRLTFLLREAENAYAMTWEQLEQDMRQKGLGSWADAITGSENADKEKRAIIAQLHEVYDAVQEAIKKEASLVKKQVDIQWNDAILPNGKSIKATYEAAISALGVQQGSVSRANSLIGAGQASERVADRLAIRQMQVQLRMQEHYYNLVRQTGQQRVDDLLRAAEEQRKLNNISAAEKLELDAKHAQMSLNLSLSKEETELAKQREEIISRTEESQNRLYTELKEWGDLLASSLQSIFEASAAGNEEYYNELAKLNLTGKGGPGAGTYVIIDDAGTSNAKAHYEYLDEREALERQHEIEQENAKAEAWKKVMDDLNEKMNDSITDWMNAMLQNQAIDTNTTALNTLTGAVNNLAGVIGGQPTGDYARNAEGMAVDASGNVVYPVQPTAPATEQPAEGGAPVSYWPMSEEHKEQIAGWNNELWQRYGDAGIETMQTMSDATAGMPSVVTNPYPASEEQVEQIGEMYDTLSQKRIAADNAATQSQLNNQQKLRQGEQQTDQQMTKSAGNMYAKMTQAANLYGIAYQTMSNDNLSTSQKFQMMAVQSAGQAAIAMLTTNWAKDQGQVAGSLPAILAECLKISPIAGAAIFAVLTGLLGGLMGVAVSKITKHKSEIAQATGTSGASAGKLATGMLTYAEGNVNEFTDPASLTPGRQYNVDAADGKTYRARYMGSNPRTHLTNGPEFHLAGEAGREMIIDAGTTRQITMNEGEIWHAIQTLSNGGRGYSQRRSAGRSGMRAFAEGNMDDFSEMLDGETAENSGGTGGISAEMMTSMQATNNRLADLLELALTNGIKAVNKWDGPDGIPNMVNQYNKKAARHGEKYL